MKRLLQSLLLGLSLLKKEEEGFTLVELIVVVVIIGILSSIAIPSFQNMSDKAKQREIATQVTEYIKAAEMFYIEHGRPALDTSDLGQYLAVPSCKIADPVLCKKQDNVDLSNTSSQTWFSPSGLFQFWFSSDVNHRNNIYAEPIGAYYPKGYSVSSCFNFNTSIRKVYLHQRKGFRKTNHNHDCD